MPGTVSTCPAVNSHCTSWTLMTGLSNYCWNTAELDQRVTNDSVTQSRITGLLNESLSNAKCKIDIFTVCKRIRFTTVYSVKNFNYQGVSGNKSPGQPLQIICELQSSSAFKLVPFLRVRSVNVPKDICCFCNALFH